MSMLAERKVKQKWSLNPRGKYWTDDQNKFGQKMLEKMGWSNGKGLGVNLDGITEHVKVNYKNDSKGMGFKERDDQWTEHEDKFSALLNSLNSGQDKAHKIEKRVTSLVEKSKNSKARIHYKKFTRGKDISRYSDKDLANVFGRKNLHKKQPEAPKESTTPEGEDSDPAHGVKTIMGGSMTDYFKNKLAKKNGFSMENNGTVRKESDSEDERPNFGFGFQSNNQVEDQEERVFQKWTPQTDAPINGDDGVVLSSSKKKKTKSNEMIQSEENVDTECSNYGFGFQSNNQVEDQEERDVFQKWTPQKDAPINGDDGVVLSSSKKKKKKSNEIIQSEENAETERSNYGFGFQSNNQVENQEEGDMFQKWTPQKDAPINGVVLSSSKKKKKKSNEMIQSEENAETERSNYGFGFQSNNQVENQEESDVFQKWTPQKDAPINGDDGVVSSSSKKKKKKSNEIIQSEENAETESSKKKKHKTLEVSVEEMKATPKKKCKKKRAVEDSDPKTPTFVSYISEASIELDNSGGTKRKSEESDEKSPKKKKKKTKDVGLCNPGFDPIFHTPPTEKHNLNTITESDEEEETVDKNKKTSELEEFDSAPKKKCKKKRTVDDSDPKTPTFVSYISEAPVEELNNSGGKKRKLEDADEKSPKKKKKKTKDVGVCNPGFDPIFHTPPMEKHNLNTITEADEEIVDENKNFDSGLNDANSRKKKKKDKIVAETAEASGKKKKKGKSEVEAGVENACFDELDDSRIQEAVVENPYEVKAKKKKRSKNKDDSLDQDAAQKPKPKLNEPSGIDNPALNLASIDDITFDMILNTTVETPPSKKPQQQGRKSVTFSDVNQEHIIPNRAELTQQNELFDINTRILEATSKRRQKNNNNNNICFDNRGFNMRSTGAEVYDKNLESSAPKHLTPGQTNSVFSDSQESTIRNELDSYQSQVENYLNEAKAITVGKPGQGLDEPKVVDDGVILPFKKASFNGVNYRYYQVNATARGSYKHLIRGDILVCFKDANLHTIEGYGTFKKI